MICVNLIHYLSIIQIASQQLQIQLDTSYTYPPESATSCVNVNFFCVKTFLLDSGFSYVFLFIPFCLVRRKLFKDAQVKCNILKRSEGRVLGKFKLLEEVEFRLGRLWPKRTCGKQCSGQTLGICCIHVAVLFLLI